MPESVNAIVSPIASCSKVIGVYIGLGRMPRYVQATIWALSSLSHLFQSVTLLVRKKMKSAQISSSFLASECRGNSLPIREELAQVGLKEVSQPMTGQN